jgi:hypothetical protein
MCHIRSTVGCGCGGEVGGHNVLWIGPNTPKADAILPVVPIELRRAEAHNLRGNVPNGPRSHPDPQSQTASARRGVRRRQWDVGVGARLEGAGVREV